MLHSSSVQTLPSLQSTALPAWHLPAAQVSPLVQALPSSQPAVLALCRQPLAGSQLSSVQGLPSLQLCGLPPTQLPFAHMSATVHTLPSSQGAVLLAFVLWQEDMRDRSEAAHSAPSSAADLPAPAAREAFAEGAHGTDAAIHG